MIGTLGATMSQLRRLVRSNSTLWRLARFVHDQVRPFSNSGDYWDRRYSSGGNSGGGSYGELAEFKAKIINKFVQDNNIQSVIEYGCGDGNQLKLAEYPRYLGFDVSPTAISLCKRIFAHDATKTFAVMQDYAEETAELALSLDVIYHLVEDQIFNAYMQTLFRSAQRFVIIYSSNTDEQTNRVAAHVRHRNFTAWIDENRPDWEVTQHIPNAFPYQDDASEGFLADFYFYARRKQKKEGY